MDPDRDDPRLPEPLIGELSRLYRTDVRVSPEVDRAIVNRARAHLARRRWLRLIVGGAGAAIAAMIVVGVLIITRPASRQAGDYYVIDGDANNDGVVDIRDAMALARKVDA